MNQRLSLALLILSSIAAACASRRAVPLERGAVNARSTSPGASAIASPTTSVGRPRDVVREASVHLRAQHPSNVLEAAQRFIESRDGFVDESNTRGAGGAASTSHATFRVPTSRYAEALAHLRTLGDVLEVTERGEDVTAERVDVEARIAAKRALEQRLIALTEHTGSVAELIQVENELGRVRGDIESMEANERALEGRIAFATIRLDVDASEQQAVASAESFGSKLRRAFHSGGVAATDVITGTVVLGTAASPVWMSLLAVWIGRRMMRRTV